MNDCVKDTICKDRMKENRHEVINTLNPVIINMGEDIVELKISLAKLSTIMEAHIEREEYNQQEMDKKINKLIDNIWKWSDKIEKQVDERITKKEFNLIFAWIYALWVAMIWYWIFMFFRLEQVKDSLNSYMLQIDRIEKKVDIQEKFWIDYNDSVNE